MLRFTIPGVGERTLEHLVLDLNGTLTTDGQLIPGVKWRISKLRDYLAIYLLTADTFGRGAVIASELELGLRVVSPIDGGKDKRQFVKELGSEQVVAIGNGANDEAMLEEAGLSIVVAGREGCWARNVAAADILVTDIRDALDMLLDERRIIATMRS